MTSLKPYPSYRQTGLPWLGQIPAHWEHRRIKFLCTVSRGASPRPIDDPRYFDDAGEYSWVRISDVTASEKYLLISEQRLSALGKSKSVPLEPGELFVSIAASVGKPIITGIKCCIHDGFVWLKGLKQDKEYFYYLLLSDRIFGGLGKTGTQLNLNSTFISDIDVPLPSLSEQRTIAAYLDHQTAKIDALIAKKERLLNLLAEQRAALISRAVTKGLNPDVKMKDSGVAWLGQVPSHWEVMPLKRISKIRYGLGQPPKEKTEGLPLIRATNIKSGVIFEKDMAYIDPLDVPPGRDAELQEGEIIVVRSGAYTGDSAVIPSKYNGAIAGYDMIVTVKEGDSLFFAWQILSYPVRDIQFSFHKLRAAQPHLNAEELKETIVTVPPIAEQKEIANYLDYQTKRLIDLATKTETVIERLHEYRAALISSAVTGKIQVYKEKSVRYNQDRME